jgi:hypothetical protein
MKGDREHCLAAETVDSSAKHLETNSAPVPERWSATQSVRRHFGAPLGKQCAHRQKREGNSSPALTNVVTQANSHIL